MIEQFLQNTTVQLIIALFSFFGGISALIHIYTVLSKNKEILSAGSKRIFVWLFYISIPLIMAVAGYGAGNIFGKLDITLIPMGIALSIAIYVIPSLIRYLYYSQGKYIAASLLLLGFPALIVCSLFLFSASFAVFYKQSETILLHQPIMWISFFALEIIFIVGVVCFSIIQIKAQRNAI